MEIRFNHVFYNKLNDIDLTIESNKIIGIYDGIELMNLLLNPKLINQGDIRIDKKLYRKFEPKLISVIEQKPFFFTSNVEEEILFHAKIREYRNNNIKNNIYKLLNELELDKSILKRICHSLSNTEKYLIKIVSQLIFEPQIIVFNDIMNGLDLHYRKLIKKLINRLKDDGKLIIVTTKDSNILYDLTDEVIVMDSSAILLHGDTNEVYTSEIEQLIHNHVDVPYFSLLTYKANKEKNTHLFYRKDVRDVIKDVYRSVS